MILILYSLNNVGRELLPDVRTPLNTLLERQLLTPMFQFNLLSNNCLKLIPRHKQEQNVNNFID